MNLVFVKQLQSVRRSNAARNVAGICDIQTYVQSTLAIINAALYHNV